MKVIFEFDTSDEEQADTYHEMINAGKYASIVYEMAEVINQKREEVKNGYSDTELHVWDEVQDVFHELLKENEINI